MMRGTRALAVAAVLTIFPAGCGVWPQQPTPSAQGTRLPRALVNYQPPRAYDVTPLIHPARKYYGVAVPNLLSSLQSLDEYAALVGKHPNLTELYASWGDRFPGNLTKELWDEGTMLYIAIEPDRRQNIPDIISGADDGYIRQYADAIRSLNLPVAFSFAHEMNGYWAPWGPKYVTPEEFVAAWRHIHEIFVATGATNVIWVWSPNQIGIVTGNILLRAYWPGDSYVNWVGLVGYYGQDQQFTFAGLFGPTVAEVRTFTNAPVLLAETGAPPGASKPAAMTDLFTAIARRSGVVGFIWFDYRKSGKFEGDWRVNSGPESLATFKEDSANLLFGFDVRHP